MKELVVSLTQYTSCDNRVVGSKAARLAQLIAHDFSVPPGFVITTYAFETFCQMNNICIADKGIAEKIAKGRFPQALLHEIKSIIKYFADYKIAVRSSGVGEDGTNFSMAGQLETYLDVVDLQKAIRNCWVALFSERVQSYTAENKEVQLTKMGVIIQQLIEPDYAGVIYTVDPLAKTGDFGIIEWVDGLGDKLVDGTQTPERCTVSRLTKALVGLNDLSKQQQLEQLSRQAYKVESIMGFPVDIEWAIQGDNIYLLQARPVTAFFTDSAKIVSSANISENFPGSIPPLTKDVAEHFYAHYLRCSLQYMGMLQPKYHTEKTFKSLLVFNSGHIYYNLSSWYACFDPCSMSSWIRSGFDIYIGQSVPVAWQGHYASGKLITLVKNIKELSVVFWNYLRADSKLKNFEDSFKKARHFWQFQDFNTLSPDSLYATWNEIIDWPKKNWGPAGFSDFLVLVTSGLMKSYADKFIQKEKNQALHILLDGIVVTSSQSVKLIQMIANEIKKDSVLTKLLNDKQYDKLSVSIKGELKEYFLKFMNDFGGRSYNESMLTNPSFIECHDIFWNLVRNLNYKNTLDSRNKPLSENSYSNKPGITIANSLLKVLRKFASKALDHRERGRLIFGLYMAEVRRVVLEIGRRCQEWGYISTDSDVFYLTSNEISEIFEGRLLFNSLKECVEIRKKNHEHGESLDLPEFFVWQHGRTYDRVPRPISKNASRVLLGLGVSSGRVCGKACIVFDPSLAHERVSGNILVAKTTDPGWTPLIASASGVIVERGGLLSHAAIVAREFGIPTIVGIDAATQIIRDGEKIDMDGDAGTVELLDTNRQQQNDCFNGERKIYV